MRFIFATLSAIALSSNALALPVQPPAAHFSPSHGHLSSRQADSGPRDIVAFPVKRVSTDSDSDSVVPPDLQDLIRIGLPGGRPTKRLGFLDDFRLAEDKGLSKRFDPLENVRQAEEEELSKRVDWEIPPIDFKRSIQPFENIRQAEEEGLFKRAIDGRRLKLKGPVLDFATDELTDKIKEKFCSEHPGSVFC